MTSAVETAPGPSRERILSLLLHAPGPVSIPALAAQLGISRNATHQHVATLERAGLVERGESISTGGRPSQGFRLSATGHAMFPRQYALLASKLVAELGRVVGPEALPDALARLGTEIAGELTPQVTATGDDPIPAIAALMRTLGYEARFDEASDEPEIEAHNCVFHDLAMRDATVCAIDLALLRTLSGRSVEHRRCMARGERSCRFAFGQAESEPAA